MSKRLRIRGGLDVVVDDDVYPVVSRFAWFRDDTGVVKTKVQVDGRRRYIPMHVFVLGIRRVTNKATGYLDGNYLNLTHENLSLMSASETTRGSKKQSTYGALPTSSRFKGVSWAKREQKWRVVGRLDGKNLDIGFFEDERDAAGAYDEFAREHYGWRATLNFPGFNERVALDKSTVA